MTLSPAAWSAVRSGLFGLLGVLVGLVAWQVVGHLWRDHTVLHALVEEVVRLRQAVQALQGGS
jgi:hypothetical protein